MTRLLSALLCVALSGCYVLVEDPPKPKTNDVPAPAPVQVPIPVPVPTPGGESGEVHVPDDIKNRGLGILWLFRIDRGTAQLAPVYERMMDDMDDEFRAQGLPISGEAIASLYEFTVLWGRNRNVPAPVPVSAALQYWARSAPQTSLSPCTTFWLYNYGQSLSYLGVDFPPELITPGGSRIQQSVHPFEEVPGAVLVVLVDSGPRPATADDPVCSAGGIPPANWYGGSSPATWVSFNTGEKLLREQTRFAFVATPEAVDSDTFRRHCLTVDGFPTGDLDVMSPSPVRFFDTLNMQMSPLSTEFDLCEVAGGHWDVTSFVHAFLKDLENVRPLQ
jgi:hypothetical protein